MRADAIRIGEIYRFPSVHAAKIKYHVCVAPGWFVFINTDASKHDCLPIVRADYPFLDHDSFINASRIFEYEPDEEIIGALRTAVLLKKTARDLIQAVQRSRVLKPVQKDVVIGQLLGALDGLS